MDLTAMTDIELGQLMLEAGDELERRRTARGMAGQLARVMDDAAVAGVPAAEVEVAITAAKSRAGAKAEARRNPPVPPAAPVQAAATGKGAK